MGRKNLVMLFLFVFLVTVVFFMKDAAVDAVDGDHLTTMCLESSLPCMELVADEDVLQQEQAEAAKTEKKKPSKTKKVKKSDGKPRVLIYHTHATESYLPTSSGNYHTTKEQNTVRDAGNVLQETLEDAGISVVHDTTLHDNPSYNDSYTRSYETVKALLKKYPTIECIIDLHRDAMAGNDPGPVTQVGGKTAATYSYVLSNTTETYASNKGFLSDLNGIAQKSFSGYTGSVLERPYWYNQELCGKAILIEMGNNRNNIEEVRECARIFGKILAEAMD
ncbi:stage II sporulation protein P [Ihubacter sp. rT4E-8]|uniref:stage II sporulation protein P n=1 Tax=unclassified Ihubacter TaxID=2633299 RepID=UPI00137A4F49